MSRAKSVFFLAENGLADVAAPQADNLVRLEWDLRATCAKVPSGRTQAAYTSERGQGDGVSSCLTPQENRSRGCRRAHVSFWFWLRLQLWLLAPRRKSRCPSRSPRKSWTPASTSNRLGRANGGACPRPALILSGVRFDLGRLIRHHTPLGIERGKAC